MMMIITERVAAKELSRLSGVHWEILLPMVGDVIPHEGVEDFDKWSDESLEPLAVRLRKEFGTLGSAGWSNGQ